MAKKKQNWKAGDYFTIKLSDEKLIACQIIREEKEALNSVLCALSSSAVVPGRGISSEDLSQENLLAVLFVTRDLLDSGAWPVVADGIPLTVSPYINLDHLRRTGFVGTKIIGSGIVTLFLEAYFGLYPWNGVADPDYFDKLLISCDKKPEHVLLK